MDLDRDSLMAAAAAEKRDDLDLVDAVLRSGCESVVLDTRDGWILRFPRPHVAFERELAVLRRLADKVPVPIPRVAWVGRATPFAAYRKLTGSQFDRASYQRASDRDKNTFAGSLAAFLLAIHRSLTPEEVRELGIPQQDFAGAVAGVRARLALVPDSVRAGVAGLLAAAEQLAAEQTVAEMVVLHNDFHFDNMALSGPVGSVVGVWDFSCVEVGVPSWDLRYLAGDSMDLLERVAGQYEQLSGRTLSVHAAVVAHRIEEVTDVLDADPAGLERLVSAWSDSGG